MKGDKPILRCIKGDVHVERAIKFIKFYTC